MPFKDEEKKAEFQKSYRTPYMRDYRKRLKEKKEQKQKLPILKLKETFYSDFFSQHKIPDIIVNKDLMRFADKVADVDRIFFKFEDQTLPVLLENAYSWLFRIYSLFEVLGVNYEVKEKIFTNWLRNIGNTSGDKLFLTTGAYRTVKRALETMLETPQFAKHFSLPFKKLVEAELLKIDLRVKELTAIGKTREKFHVLMES